MRKTYKYRLLGNRLAFEKAEQWIELCRQLYNCALEERILAWKMQQHSISLYDQQYELPEIKKVYPEYKHIDAQVLRSPLRRLDLAFKAYFRHVKNREKAGFPRFKGKGRYNSFTMEQNSWQLDGVYLTIRNIGRFKLRLSRPIKGTIKTITILKDSMDRWYVYFSCDNVPNNIFPISDKIVGLDVGIKSFLVDSEGGKIDNPQYIRQSEKLLRRRQRRLSRRIKGSNRRHKARILVAKAHEKVHNQRLDFLHKTANYYIKNYGTLVFENLHIKGMVRNHNLAKSINDSGWGTFIELCTYKAEYAGRKVIRISRFEPSSKTCSECGAINHELKLSDRQWVCTSCGVLHDRDFNAAKNICRVGQTLQAQTKENTLSVACKSHYESAKTGLTVTKYRYKVNY